MLQAERYQIIHSQSFPAPRSDCRDQTKPDLVSDSIVHLRGQAATANISLRRRRRHDILFI